MKVEADIIKSPPFRFIFIYIKILWVVDQENKNLPSTNNLFFMMRESASNNRIFRENGQRNYHYIGILIKKYRNQKANEFHNFLFRKKKKMIQKSTVIQIQIQIYQKSLN